MINTTAKTKGALDQNSLSSINHIKRQGALTAQNLSALNRTAVPGLPQPQTGRGMPAGQPPVHTRQTTQAQMPHRQDPAHAQMPNQQIPPARPKTAAQADAAAHTALPAMTLPPLIKPVQKGQKVPLETGAPLADVKACFGWNTTNPQCDVDVSAFLLGGGGKVLGDSWFVFYGQTVSPDKSCVFQPAGTKDREIVTIDFQKLDPRVKKIVFVLTINDAFEKRLHFGMMKDAYVRILRGDGTELASFQMAEYYSNVISMMIGEIYQYNGSWKFNAVGNGVSKDLAGLCALYGVQVSD